MCTRLQEGSETRNICWRVGDRGTWQPITFGGDEAVEKDKGFVKSRKMYPGTVTYINEPKGWYQVTFDNGVKECFFFDVEPEEPRRVPINRSRLYGGAEWQS